jgi:hypothetical protein
MKAEEEVLPSLCRCILESDSSPILLINFIGTLGFSIVLPFRVFLVRDFGGNAIVFGILSATYPAFQLIGAPNIRKMV